MPPDAAALIETATQAAHAAAAVILAQGGGAQSAREKAPGDLVTETDRAAQDAALGLIRALHPESVFVAEEDDSTHHRSEDGFWTTPPGLAWMVDPIDGTSNFASGLPIYCVAIGVAIDGQVVAGVVFDPLREELFAAGSGLPLTLNGEPLPALQPRPLRLSLAGVGWAYEPGVRERMIRSIGVIATSSLSVRALGSSALALAYVAAGRLGLFVNFGLKPWDVAAAIPLVLAAGAEFRGIDGSPWRLGQPALMAGHPSLIEEALAALR